MSVFWKAVFGKIVAAVFLAICAILGYGPVEWAEYLITNGPTWLTPKLAQFGFSTLAFITLIALLWNTLPSLISASKLWLNRVFSDIEWFDGPHSIHSFGYIISKPHNLALVGHIQLRGRNTSKSLMTVKKAYLRSLVTGERLNADIEHINAENIEIKGGTSFSLIVKFPNEDGHLAQNSISGISFESFLKRFSNFEIVIETGSKTYRIEFNGNETQQWVASVHMGLMMPAPSEKAGVLKKIVNE